MIWNGIPYAEELAKEVPGTFRAAVLAAKACGFVDAMNSPVVVGLVEAAENANAYIAEMCTRLGDYKYAEPILNMLQDARAAYNKGVKE